MEEWKKDFFHGRKLQKNSVEWKKAAFLMISTHRNEKTGGKLLWLK